MAPTSLLTPASLLSSHRPLPHVLPPNLIPTPPLHFSHLRRRRRSPASLAIAAATPEPTTLPTEEPEQQESKPGFIEIGYISSVHGIRGELRVKPSTDFPELRFTKPGKRWLRTRVSGRESVSEVELIEGRGNSGQKGWIISLAGIDTVEQAKQIVGSTLLVKEGDRPELEEGEFYNPDLVGMRVVLKETGRYIGTVINVYNTGASDLLQVMLNSNEDRSDYSDSSTPEIDSSGPLVWIPLVEAIVPDIDVDLREMQITPPKGLLELNVRSDTRNKKERRLMEWKERQKLRQRLISAKKKICEIGQKHLLEGFRFGEKSQKSSLANQIVDLNLRLFRHAVQSISTPSGSYNFPKFLSETSNVLPEKTLRVSHRSYISCAIEKNNGENSELYKEGYRLLEESKAAFIINVSVENSDGCNSEPSEVTSGRSETAILQFQELFLDCKKFLKVEEKDISIPVILVSPAHEIPFYEEFLSNNDYFNFDRQKVEFLEEEKLPIVSAFADQGSNKILLKSPWEILQASIGSGGVLSLLSSHKVLEELNVKGVEYVQVCSLSGRSAIGHPLFFGLVKFRGADLGIKIFEGSEGHYEYDMIFSLRYLSKISKQVDKMQFYAVPEQHEHVELVGKEWNKVEPETPNSFRFCNSIYSCLNTCPLEKLCIMQITKVNYCFPEVNFLCDMNLLRSARHLCEAWFPC